MKKYTPLIQAFFLLISFIDLFSMDFNKSSDIAFTKFEELMYRSRSHFDNNPDSTIILAEMAYKYSQDIRERGYVLEAKGIAYLLNGNHKIGFKKLGEAYVCFRDENDKTGLISIYIDLGKYYLLQRQYKNSLKYYLKAKEIAIKSGMQDFLSVINKSLGDIYCFLNEYDSAIECYSTLLSLNKNKNREVDLMCQYNIARICFKMDNFHKADSILKLCMELLSSKDHFDYLSDIYLLQGHIALNTNRYLQMEKLYEKSLSFCESKKDSFYSKSYIVASYIINQRNNYDDVEITKYYKSLNNKIRLGDHYKNLAMAYYITKQYKQGNMYYNKAHNIYSQDNYLFGLHNLVLIKEEYNTNFQEKYVLLKEKEKITEKINKQQIEMLQVQNEFDALFINYVDRINNNLQKEKQRTKQMLIISISTVLTLIIFLVFFIIIRKKNRIIQSRYQQLVDSNELINKDIVTELRRIYHKAVSLESKVFNEDKNKSLKNNFIMLFENITNLLNLLSEQKNKQ